MKNRITNTLNYKFINNISFLDHVLQPPSYGWQDATGKLIKPSNKEIITEFFKRFNIFKDRRNWLPFFSWFKIACLIPFFFIFLTNYLTWWTVLAAFVYSMIIMGTHGTIWHHRYCTHGAYKFKNPFWRFVTQNLTISVIPEEIYVISHHVHHAKSDQPGDPYNAQAGFLYCFLADVNHQPISKNLNEQDYNRVKSLMSHTGVPANSYHQYKKWGSYVPPVYAIVSSLLNWAFWYSVFFLIGGHPLACSLFGAAAFWGIGVRTFNYEGHAKGEDKQKEGTDFSVNDKSINQVWPGIVAGEWHNNHHLFPKSARSGFKPHQVDLAWYYIKLLHKLGAISSYRDDKKLFYKRYHNPYLEAKSNKKNEDIIA
ncbi:MULTISPECIES: fatty acid desaturase [Sphingobacterium]|uniref:fatty acid desaturase n=1 Tax=Sphingobacterium TaxID=28453 RepID=UPI0010D03EA8|nr:MULTISPECIES: fatty acid desaturase [Sphingobacterium]MCW2263338.1 stearoyl-CoA desaturase (delta-9 desaturase) [Sphingobacterium kitahiroshimense]TCR11678.1 stearoyl-CoA desaturase (delta-9 desaturase) [Sphingobacterium sp. JUb78]